MLYLYTSAGFHLKVNGICNHNSHRLEFNDNTPIIKVQSANLEESTVGYVRNINGQVYFDYTDGQFQTQMNASPVLNGAIWVDASTRTLATREVQMFMYNGAANPEQRTLRQEFDERIQQINASHLYNGSRSLGIFTPYQSSKPFNYVNAAYYSARRQQ